MILCHFPVGYGSYATSTLRGQVFTVCFALVGIGVAGVALDSTSRMLLGVATAIHSKVSKSRLTSTQELKIALLMVLPVLSVFALGFTVLEGWSFVDSFYFVWVTASTIGLGDFVPSTVPGLALIFLCIDFCLGLVAFALSAAGDALESAAKQQRDKVRGMVKRGQLHGRRRSLAPTTTLHGAADSSVNHAMRDSGDMA